MKTIDFEMTDGIHLFKDAIVLSDEQYASMSEAEIEAEKQRRWNDYLDLVLNPPVSEENNNG